MTRNKTEKLKISTREITGYVSYKRLGTAHLLFTD